MADQIDTDEGEQPHAAKHKVFLSYTRDEIEQAKAIIALLEADGFDVWWDGLLDGGVTYLHTTEAALESADCVVVLWSQKSVNSNWVRDEAQSGRERGCLVPISLDGTMAPLGFRQIQLIDLSGWKGDPSAPEAQKIITAVRKQIGGAGVTALSDTAAPRLVTTTSAPPHISVSRRALLIGGLTVAGVAAAFGGWQLGLFESLDSAPVPMAVLRFANLTGDEEQAWFSDGLANELRQVLSRNPLLRVSAPTSSTSDTEDDDFALGKLLGVSNIVRGSVQRVENTVRIFAELIQVDDGLVRWSQSYDRNIDDVLGVQSEIADTVAFALVTQIATEEEARETLDQQKAVGGTSDVKAYEAYLQGRAFLARASGVESDRAALERFETAIAIDPVYATAHAWRSTACSAIANAAGDAAETDRMFASAIAAGRRSIELEPRLAQGHMALAFALSYGSLDFSGAYEHYKQAQELAPGDSSVQGNAAIFFAYGDQHELATRMINRVLELDPLNGVAFRAAGFIALLGHDYDTTVARMEQSLSLNPKIASARYAIGVARYMQGDISAAKASFETEPVPLFKRTGLAISNAKLGDKEAAKADLAVVIEQFGDASLYQQAQIHAQWGENAEALAALKRAFEEGDPGVLWALNDPLLDPIRAEPSFDQLLLPLRS